MNNLISTIHTLASTKTEDPQAILDAIAALTAPRPQANRARARSAHRLRWTQEEIDFVLEHKHKPYSWLAEQLGRTTAAVGVKARALGVYRRTNDDSIAKVRVGRMAADAGRNESV